MHSWLEPRARKTVMSDERQVTPERWKQIEELYHSALGREKGQRAEYLRQVCSGDDALRQDVESLLTQGSGAARFLEVPALEAAAKMLGENSSQSLIGRQIGSYQILSLLGAGGMGEVYRSRDIRLDRDVALKVLPAGLLADEAARRRFRKEALALAKLNNPHIAVIYDVGEEAGVDYLAMECVPGQSLAEKLKSGVLPEKEVAPLGGQIAEALEEAHEHGVIHRDLKPGNIMVTPKGQVKVLDFGLAKLLRPATHMVATESFTETHGVAGTLPYVAPEQLTGEPVDARTDIYALGVVLFEMAAGRRPFQEDSAPRLTDAILHQAPVPPRALNSRVSPELERITLKCLEKSPSDRYQSAKEVQVDLRRIGAAAITSAPAKTRPWWHRRTAFGIAAVALLASLAAAGWVYRSAGQRETIDSLAVLPFVNATADPNTEYFSDGITESLINSLSQLPNLKIKSRDSVFHYKGKDRDAQQVGRELGVRAIFKGRLTQQGDTLAISAELIDARNDDHIWGQQYNRKLADIFVLQEEIAKEITDRLRVRLTGEEQKHLDKHYTVNPEAYQDYLKGRYWWNKQNREGFDKGIEYFQQAIAKDPNYALAYVGLADSYNMAPGVNFASPMEAYPKARENAVRALELDDTLAEAHTALATVKTLYDWDWSGAETEFKRAIELNPNYGLAHQWYGLFLDRIGRAEQSIEEHKRALELDPLSVGLNRSLGSAYYFARQYDQAVDQLKKTLDMDPNFITAHAFLGDAYIQKSMLNEALTEFQESGFQGLVGYAYAVMGKRAEAQKIIDQLKSRAYVPAGTVALIYTALGEKDEALKWLNRSFEDRSIGSGNLKLDPSLDPLRSDPRFSDLLRRMNLQP